jgi:electron transfer flavoprotein alpha subunit
MSAILVYTSIINRSVSMPTKEVLGMARAIARKTGDSVTAALVGADVSDLASELIACGADQVCICEHVKLSEFCANLYLKAFEAIVEKVSPRIVLIPGEATGTDIAPRLAQRIKGGLITDCIEYEVSGDTVIYTKPVYGSKALARIRITTPIALVTVRPRTQDVYPEAADRAGETIQLELPLDSCPPEMRTIERMEEEVVECALEEANVVVSGGRGLQDAEAFEQLRELAGLLNGAVGASRVAVDQALVPPSCQIGLTGKIVAPDVYFAIGLSGASQHIAGMSASKYIVAINNDEDAPIFDISNVGVVEDFRNVLPVLIAELKKHFSIS